MKKAAVAVGLVVALWGVWGVAQESKEGRSGTGGMMQHMMKQPGSAQMPMGDMMQNCKEHHQSAMKSMDEISKIMEDAKQSNDPAKMRSALDEGQKHLGEMKEHMVMCGNMMNMMEKMQGKSGMMKGGSK